MFNLGESATTSLRDLIRLIEESVGRKARIERLPEQPGDVPLTCASIDKARRVLGYDPQTAIRDGIPRFVDWFLENQPPAAPVAPGAQVHHAEAQP